MEGVRAGSQIHSRHQVDIRGNLRIRMCKCKEMHGYMVPGWLRKRGKSGDCCCVEERRREWRERRRRREKRERATAHGRECTCNCHCECITISNTQNRAASQKGRHLPPITHPRSRQPLSSLHSSFHHHTFYYFQTCPSTVA